MPTYWPASGEGEFPTITLDSFAITSPVYPPWQHLFRSAGTCYIPWMAMEATLLSDAERTENQVQNIVGGGGSSHGIEGAKSVVEIEQQHFMRNFGGHCARGGGERSQRFLHQALMADIGEKSGFGLRPGFAADVAQNFGAQFGDAFASERGRANHS